MKNILLFVISILFVSCASLINLKEFNGYKSSPQYIQIDNYGFKKGEKLLMFRTILEFDMKGRTISHQLLNPDLTLRGGKWEHIYDKSGNEIELNLLNVDGSFHIRYLYQFNQKGKEILREHIQGKDTRKIITQSNYDKDGNLIKKVKKFADGRFNSHLEFEYNSKGEKIASIEYDSNGIQKSKTEFLYDDDGNEIENKKYDKDGALNNIFKSKYNEFGDRIIGKKYVVKEGEAKLIQVNGNEFKYDSRGNIIVDKSFFGDTQLREVVHTIKYWN